MDEKQEEVQTEAQEAEPVVERGSPEQCKPSSKFRCAYLHLKWFFPSLIQHFQKSNMEKWVENEVNIACKLERGSDTKSKKWDYGCACYDGALKAYKALLKQGHSGCSISITQQILNRMIDGKPLTPIEDTPDVWEDLTCINGPEKDVVGYQCKRMSALFKDVHKDGTVEYHDVGQCYCVDVKNGATYTNGLIARIIRELYPITMPYYPPTKSIKVYCSDLLTDHQNGDFDTIAVFYLVKPDGERVDINRFFKSDDKIDTDWAELTKEEYDQRQVLADALIESDKKAKADRDISSNSKPTEVED